MAGKRADFCGFVGCLLRFFSIAPLYKAANMLWFRNLPIVTSPVSVSGLLPIPLPVSCIESLLGAKYECGLPAAVGTLSE